MPYLKKHIMKIFEEHSSTIQILGGFLLLILLCFNTSFTIVLNNNVESDQLQYDTLEPVQHVKMLDLTKFKAIQSSTNYGAGARFAIDGNMDSDFKENDLFNSVTCTRTQHDPWWQVDLETLKPIDHIVVWNRTDDGVGFRLNNYVLEILDEAKRVVFTYRHEHNYDGTNSFVSDTISKINTLGRYVKIRLETHSRNRERLSIAEVQLFTFQLDNNVTNRVFSDSKKKASRPENSFVEPVQKLGIKDTEDIVISKEPNDSTVKISDKTKDKYYRELIDTKDMNLLDLTGFTATQTSTNYGAGADFAIDGNTNSDFLVQDLFNSISCTYAEVDPWWQVDLEKSTEIKRIIVWNRTDGNVEFRLNNYILEILNESHKVIYRYKHQHNYTGTSSFVRDTIYGVHTSGRFVRIRLETGGKKERLTITEVQLFN